MGSEEPENITFEPMRPSAEINAIANSTWVTPTVTSSSDTAEADRARSGRTTQRSTPTPTTIPTGTHTPKATHQLQPQSMTNLASSWAERAPSWAWARFRNRFDL